MSDLTVVDLGDLRLRRPFQSWRVVDTTGREWMVTKTILGWRVRNKRGRELLADRPTARRIIAAVQRHEASR